MRNATSSQRYLQICSLRALRKSRGLKIFQNDEGLEFWNKVLHFTPWVLLADISAPDVWTCAACLARKKKIKEDDLMALSFLLIIAAVNQCLGTLEPQDDPSEKKAQEDRGQGSNEEEDPEDCPVSDLLTLEKAIRLGRVIP